MIMNMYVNIIKLICDLVGIWFYGFTIKFSSNLFKVLEIPQW